MKSYRTEVVRGEAVKIPFDNADRFDEDVASAMPPTSLALIVPKDVEALATGSNQFLEAAEAFAVDSEPAFQVADEVQARLKAEAKAINDKRLEFTRPIDAIKKKWMDFFSPAIEGRTKAATVYQRKMSAYLAEQREKEQRRQLEAEAQQRKQREMLEAEARKKEEAAQKLKSEGARQRKLEEAASLREIAAITPASVPVAPPPQTVASNVAGIWEVEAVVDTSAYLRWLADHPEWHCVLKFADAEHKRLAKQFHSIGVPGLKFIQRDSFRTKSGRR